MPWHCLDAATHAVVPRVPFRFRGRHVGSVAAAHLPALRGFAALRVDADAVTLDDGAAFAPINRALRAQGLVAGWRDEIFSVFDPVTQEPLAETERAAARFWGLLTLGAHATGYVAGADERPHAIWVAQRSASKATDPGLFDNLAGGGIGHGQAPAATLVREAWEEAGLRVAPPTAHAGVLRLARDIAEGFQHEWLYAYDLRLDAGTVPSNQDGEVQRFELLSVADALALAATPAMTVDAALVTLDFALRHGLSADPALQRAIGPLRVRG